MISEAAYRLCVEIEKLPASEIQTQISVIAAELRKGVAELEASGALNDEMLRHELAEEQFARGQAEAKSARLGRKLQRLGLHLAETRKKLRKVEGERNALRERCEKLESVRKEAAHIACLEEIGGEEWNALDAALAATEVK